MQTKKFSNSAFKIALLCGCTATAGLSAPAFAQEEDEQARLDVVVVQGLRASLATAVDQKRNANTIVDTVNAEDIGAFPDQDISESLQRITGVQIGRDPVRSNEVQIRGLSQSRVELNGRSLVGADASRNVNFEDVPSELLNGIEVYKSASADQIEGGIGGLVRLKTRRPLDLDGLTFAGSVLGDYATRAEEMGYRVSGLVGNKYDTSSGEFGWLLNVALSDSEVRTDAVETRGFQTRTITDAVGDPIVDANGNAVITPNQLRPIGWRPRTERLSVNGIAEWAPTSELRLFAEGFYTDFDRSSEGTLSIFRVGGSGALQPGYTTSPDGTLLSGTYSNVTVDNNGRIDQRKREVYNIAAGGDWTSGDYNINGDISYGVGDGGGFRFAQIRSRTSVADINFDFSDVGSPISIVTQGDLTDPANYSVNRLVDTRIQEKNEEFAARIEGSRSFDGFIDQVKVGARYSSSEANRSGSAFNNAISLDAGGNVQAGGGTPVPQQDFPGLNSGGFGFNDFLDGHSPNLPAAWFSPNSSFVANPNFISAFGFNYATDAFDDQLAGFSVEENTFAGFAKVEFSTVMGDSDFYGDFGIRIVNTEVSSSGVQTNPLGGFTPITVESDYTEVLPSLNLSYDLTEDLKLRFAASRVMGRPELPDLSPSILLNFGTNLGSAGNPALEPFTANQVDLSLEWYFAPGSILSGAVFHKDVEAFLQRTAFTETYTSATGEVETFLVTRPESGESGEISGFEIGFVHAFEDQLPAPFDGFGIQANYTYVDSTTPEVNPVTGASVPLEDLSENSYNLIGFYEKGPITARLAYNWRDNFLDTTIGQGGTPEFADARGTLDASIEYRLSEQWVLSLDGVNLTDTETFKYANLEERQVLYEASDTRILFGARFKY